MITKSIGLDLDGVLFDFSSYFLKYLNIADKSPATSWGDTRYKDNLHLVHGDHIFWSNLPLLVDSKEINFPVVRYVTARPVSNEVSQKAVIAAGFPNAPVVTVGVNGDKYPYLVDIDIFIDDAVHNFENLNNKGVTCYLMTRPHNVNYDAGHLRVNNIQEFKEKINGKI